MSLFYHLIYFWKAVDTYSDEEVIKNGERLEY